MEISSRDESDSAKFDRLQKTVEELKIRLGPDPLAGDDFQDIRPVPVDTGALETLLAERATLLVRFDAQIDGLGDFVRDEIALRNRIIEQLNRSGAGKQFRPHFSGSQVSAVILKRLSGEMRVGIDDRFDRSVAPARMASLSAIHDTVLAVAEGLYAERETPAPVALTRSNPPLLEAPK